MDNVADSDAASSSAILTLTPPPITESSQGLEQTLSLPWFDLETEHCFEPKFKDDNGDMKDYTIYTPNTTPPPNSPHLLDSLPTFDNSPIFEHSYFDTPSPSPPPSYDRDTPLPSIEPSSPAWTYNSSSVSPTTTSTSSRSLSPLSSISPSPHNYNSTNTHSPSLDDLDLRDDEEDFQYTLACIQYTNVYDVCGSSVWLQFGN